jgi:hypothetical protein
VSIPDTAVTASTASVSAAAASQVATSALAAETNRLQVLADGQATTIAAQAARIAELEDLLNPPPVGRTAPLLLGAVIAPRDGQTWATAASVFEQQVAPVQITRRFTGGLPSNLAGISSITADRGRRHRWLSMKGDAAAPQIAAALRTLPVDGLLTIVALHHEPDNDIADGQPDHTPAWFQGRLTALAAAVDIVRAEGRTDIVKSFVLTGYLDVDNEPGTSLPWFPADPTGWIYGFDQYDPNARGNLIDKYDLCVAEWRRHGGRMWAVTETGTKLTGPALADQLTGAIAHCDLDPDCVAWCWFHSATGRNGPWWLDDPDGQAALATAITSSRARWADHPLITNLP